MRTTDARKIITQLASELLVKSENVYLDGDSNRGSFVVCYYIDYQQFVDVVRYRVHLMQKFLSSEETTELTEVFYQVDILLQKNSFVDYSIDLINIYDYNYFWQ